VAKEKPAAARKAIVEATSKPAKRPTKIHAFREPTVPQLKRVPERILIFLRAEEDNLVCGSHGAWILTQAE
jgi:hypothetical protein